MEQQTQYTAAQFAGGQTQQNSAQLGVQQASVLPPPTAHGVYTMGYQQPQYVVQLPQQPGQSAHAPQYMLSGKPLGTADGAPETAPASLTSMSSSLYHAPRTSLAGFNMPFITLPGGTMIRPQIPSAPGSGTYPQLTGLPAGVNLAAAFPQVPHSNTDIPTIPSQPFGAYGSMSAPHHLQGVPQHIQSLPPLSAPPRAVAIKTEEERPSSSHSANTSAGGLGSDGSPQVGSGGTPGSGGNKSRYRGVSYDRKKAKWRVQIKVAALGKSGVSVGYFDTEELAARAYDRAAIGLLGRDNPNLQTNFDLSDYAEEPIPLLTGKTREEVKTTLKTERIKQAPRRRFTSRQRTSRFMGVGSSNRKNQWQARILVHGKVTHLGYYETEEEAARVYDRVSLALHGSQAQTNFPGTVYAEEELAPYRGLDREDLQRALGVKPMDKSSRFRGVSKKKGKWEAKVMVNRRWAYRELFDSEEEAARAYDRALWRLKPREARSYVNFKDEIPSGAERMAGDYGRAVIGSDGDFADSDAFQDDVSDGGDFEYEYRPTKGTQRSASMRAKRFGSAPNLAGQGSMMAAAHGVGGEEDPGFGVGSPAFVSLPGGGLQLQFGSGGPPPAGMIPNPGSGSVLEEPLLIRVGSETHFLPTTNHSAAAPSSSGGGGGGVQTLGKRSGMQRIQSEPQFSVASRENDLLVSIPGAMNTGDIHDLMNDRDLFRGLDLGYFGSHSGGGGDDAVDLELQALSDFMQTEGGGVHRAGGVKVEDDGQLIFEDEELALANLAFEGRPRKMSKSMSMSQLSSLAGVDSGSPVAALQDLSPKLGSPSGRPPRECYVPFWDILLSAPFFQY